MLIIAKGWKYLTDKQYRTSVNINLGKYNGMPDEEFLKLKFKNELGYELDLNNPVTFNEKLQWLKIHDRNPLYTKMVDKYEAKQYVADIIGEEYIIPTLGVWNCVEDIPFEQLPERYVLKTTHDSGGIVICRDKNNFDVAAAKRKLNKSLHHDYYQQNREWPYKDVQRRIIAEQYMEDISSSDLPDYKVHNFQGIPRIILVCRDRFKDSGLTEDFYTAEWEHLNVKRPAHPQASEEIEKPKELQEMLGISKKLSKDIPFLRTDFYSINGRVFFGEMTFFPSSGMQRFDPDSYDELFGSWITLNIPGGVLLRNNNIFILIAQEEKRCVGSGELRDYKFFCFNGEVKFFKVDFDRFIEHHANYFDREQNLLPFGEVICPPKPEKELIMPVTISEMIKLAEKLSQGIKFVRIDFYDVGGRIYFGEITFFPASGMGKFTPPEWDRRIGEYLQIEGNS